MEPLLRSPDANTQHPISQFMNQNSFGLDEYLVGEGGRAAERHGVDTPAKWAFFMDNGPFADGPQMATTPRHVACK